MITTSGSSMPLATPVAISTTLPPAVTAMQQQGIILWQFSNIFLTTKLKSRVCIYFISAQFEASLRGLEACITL